MVFVYILLSLEILFGTNVGPEEQGHYFTS